MTRTIERPPVALPDIEDITRRDFLVGGAGLLALSIAGYGTGRDTTGEATDTRTVTDPAGREVAIPAEPPRIVVLDPGRILVDLVALGFVPVGAATIPTTDGGFPPTLGPVADEITSVGDLGGVNLERVTSLNPDLIFFATDYQALSVDTLSQIAPTISYPRPPEGLLERTRWLGDLLDREERAAEVVRDFEAMIADHPARPRLAGRRVAMLNLLNYEAGQNVLLFGPGTNVTEPLEMLGAKIAPGEVAGEPVGDELFVSVEQLPDALADIDVLVALYYDGPPENDRYASQRTDSPVWEAILTVARGDVAYLDLEDAGLETAFDDLVAQLDDRRSGP